MKKNKVGVLGAYRGSSMINYCSVANNAEVVAICDKWEAEQHAEGGYTQQAFKQGSGK